MIGIYSLVYINNFFFNFHLFANGPFQMFFFPFKLWPSSEHFFSSENEFCYLVRKTLHLALS